MSDPLSALAELVRHESGIRLAEHQHDALRAALARAAPGLEPEDFVRLAADPVQRGGVVTRLLEEVTVQESAFFRDRAALEGLRWPELLAAAEASGHAVVRVWIAGCARGEEAYTLAILAREAFGPHPPVSIVATDISRRALSLAQDGRYRERALREVDRERRARWLRPADGGVVVGEDLRRLVHFRRHNLVTEPAPPAGEAHFHLIACRNVLIYFDAPTAGSVRRRLEEALAPGGVLLLGTADALAAARTQVVARTHDRSPAERRAPARVRRSGVLTRERRLAGARLAADAGRAAEALADVETLLRRDPLDADAHALRGLVELAGGDHDAAVVSLRRALYAEPAFGLAAFMLGRAQDAAGRPAAARSAYAWALRSLGPEEDRHSAVFGQVDLSEVAAACRSRLEGGTP